MAMSTWLMLVAIATLQLRYSGAQEVRTNPCGSFLLPRAIIAGTNSVVWVSSHKPNNLTLRIVEDALLLEENIFIQEITPIEFQVPGELKRNVLNMQIFADCHENGVNCSLCDSYDIQVLPAVKDIEIQLEHSVFQKGQTVSIWFAVIDHLGNAIFDPTVDVYIKDPSNSTVKMWKNVQLRFGIGNLQLELSKGADEGFWSVIVQSQSNQFSKQFEVVNEITPFDDQEQENDQLALLTEPHFVEINFGTRSSSSIRPRTPYLGEIITSTSEKGITVRLELTQALSDNETLLYNSTIKFWKNNSQLFIIPGLQNLTGNVTLKAILESIEGQTLDNKFVLATRQLTVDLDDKCLYQVFPAAAKYQFDEGEILNVVISSSCSFSDAKINYVVNSDSGHVTAWGQEFLALTNVTDQGIVNLTITVIDSMKPRSVISVFSALDSGIIALDSFEILVRSPEVKDQLLIKHTSNEMLKINITKVPGEVQCIIGSWQTGNSPKWIRPSSVTLKANSSESYPNSNHPILFGTVLDTWMLQCLESATSSSEEVEVHLSPDSNGRVTRTLQVFTIDNVGKVRRSTRYSLSELSTPSWRLEFQLPPTARVDEELIVDIHVHNDQSSCSQTELSMALKGGAIFAANRKKFLSQPACLSATSKTTYRVGVQLIQQGPMTFTAQLKATGTSSCCGLSSSAVVDLDAEQELRQLTTLSETMDVLQSGFTSTKTEKYLFCQDEVEYRTNSSYFSEGEAFPLSTKSKSIVLQVAASADIRIALHKEKRTTESAYHFVLGGDDNSLSWISYGSNSFSNILQKVSTPKLLRHDKFQTFWISWDSKKLDKSRKRRHSDEDSEFHSPRLSLGRGSSVGSRVLLTVFLEGMQDLSDAFQYIKFATGWGNPAFFRIWGLSAGLQQTTSTFHLEVPKGSAANNARAEIAIKGGFSIGIQDFYEQSDNQFKYFTLEPILEQFYRSPEQNPNGNWNLLLQDILKFRSSEGYFHNGDLKPNIKLTALALQAVHLIGRSVSIDNQIISETLEWMHSTQNDNGSFFTHKSVESVDETSYVLSVLSDFQYEDLTSFQVVSSAQRFLEQELISVMDFKRTVQTSSAIILSRSSMANEALNKVDSVFQKLADCLTQDGCLDLAVDALAAYFHANIPEKYLIISKLLINADWKLLNPTERIKALLILQKYGKLLQEPLRNIHVGISFLPANLTTSDKDLENNKEEYKTAPLEELQRIHGDSPALRYKVPKLPQNLQFSVSGTGCVTLQNTIFWDSPLPDTEVNNSPWISIEVNATSNGTTKSELELPEKVEFQICIKNLQNVTLYDFRLEILMPSSFTVENVHPLSSKNVPSDISKGTALLFVPEMSSGEVLCFEVFAQRRGLVRNVQPGRISAVSNFFKHTSVFSLN